MGYKIDEIEGIGPAYREKLAAAGISNTDELLSQCCTPRGRKQVSESTGIGEKTLLGWTNMADLMRVSGIARQFAELLEASGVDTIKELRNRNPENLATKMQEVNAQKKLAKTSPNTSVVEGWVAQAKLTEPKIEY